MTRTEPPCAKVFECRGSCRVGQWRRGRQHGIRGRVRARVCLCAPCGMCVKEGGRHTSSVGSSEKAPRSTNNDRVSGSDSLPGKTQPLCGITGAGRERRPLHLERVSSPQARLWWRDVAMLHANEFVRRTCAPRLRSPLVRTLCPLASDAEPMQSIRKHARTYTHAHTPARLQTPRANAPQTVG